MGASMKPIPIPRMTVAPYSIGMEVEKAYSSQPTKKGILTRIMDHLRPKNSTMSPDIRLPSGWQMNAMLPGMKSKVLKTEATR
jgi:hypothetical protein